jgi:hypothetical protein
MIRGDPEEGDEGRQTSSWSTPSSVQVCPKQLSYACTDSSPGVQPHRDLRSGVWNFPSEFSTIPTPEEYAFDRSPKYITPSQDTVSQYPPLTE